jgi:hypothetical protein
MLQSRPDIFPKITMGKPVGRLQQPDRKCVAARAASCHSGLLRRSAACQLSFIAKRAAPSDGLRGAGASNGDWHLSDAPIAIVRSYDELLMALRARVAALHTPMEVIDYVAGLPLRYSSKLLSPCPVKGLGRTSLGPLLGALGLKLAVMVDEESFRKIAHRLTKRRYNVPMRPPPMRPPKKASGKGLRDWSGNSQWAAIMNARRMLIVSPRMRSENARKAALARWHPEADAG